MLAPGHHLFRGSDGGWRYSTPDGSFVRITGPDHLLARFADAELEDDDRLAALVAALTERGVLAEPTATPPRDLRIHLDGDGPVADALAAVLAPARPTRGPADEGVVARSDLLVSVSGWLPDARWRTVDAWCVRHGTAWHRSHAEGTAVAIGPLYLPGPAAPTASYADLRGRRLAASRTADELLGLWAHLDSGDAAPPSWSAGTAATVAGLIGADVDAWRRGATPPSHGHQLLLDPATATLTRHPVLALPVLDRAGPAASAGPDGSAATHGGRPAGQRVVG